MSSVRASNMATELLAAVCGCAHKCSDYCMCYNIYMSAIILKNTVIKATYRYIMSNLLKQKSGEKNATSDWLTFQIKSHMN